MNDIASSSMTGNLAANIRLLCERHGSIADVCRLVEINRQQFNKYLAGRVLPNPITLRRLCEFFSVTEKDLFLNPEAFGQAIARDQSAPSCLPGRFGELLCDMATGATDCMEQGLYYAYYPWLRDTTKTLRALLAVRKRGQALTFKRFTRIATSGHNNKYRLRSKHDGVIFERQGTLFMVAVNNHARGGLSLMTFGQSAVGQTGIFVGLALVMTSWGDPIASRVTLVSVPSTTTMRQALGQCGVVDLHANDIDSITRETITAPETGPFAQLMAYSVLQRTLG